MDQVADRQLDALTDEELDILERQIADKYMRIVPWGAVVWGIGNCLIFFSLFPLVLMGFRAALARLPNCHTQSHVGLPALP